MLRPVSALLVVVLLAGACGDDTSGDTTPTTEPTGTVATTRVPAGDDTDTPIAPTLWPGVDPTAPGVQRLEVEVVRRIDHDPTAFTQGLEVDGAHLYEGTGWRGQSTLRRIDPDTGEILDSVALEAELFGEGLTVTDAEIVQLTWQAGRALRHDPDTLDRIGEYRYDGEGWGLCHDGDRFWMSDGSTELTVRDDGTFAVVSTRPVTRDDGPVGRLNELECVRDAGTAWVLANVWYADEILVIDPVTGRVEAVIDATPLVTEAAPTDPDHVLNGIAALDDGTLLLGGKNWPTTFVVRLLPG